MLTARKPLSIGPHVIQPGEKIEQEALRLLPPGRLVQLVSTGFVDETADEVAMERDVAELKDQLAALTEEVKILRAQMTRMRPQAKGGGTSG